MGFLWQKIRHTGSIPSGWLRQFYVYSVIDDIRLTVAGTAGGSIVDAAKLGIKCLALGALGDDEKAEFMVNKLKGYGVDTSVMRRYPGLSTSSTILTIRPDGSRPALHVRGVSDHFELSAEAVSKALDAKVVHFGGTGLLAKVDGQPTVDFMRAAKEAGRITTYDLIAARPETIELVLPVLPWVDYFMPSIDEAAVMCLTEPKNSLNMRWLPCATTTPACWQTTG